MKKRYRSIIVIFLILLLFLIRSFASDFFYDPFVKYFNGAFLTGSFPEINISKLLLNMGLRYFINSVVSLAVIYTIFVKKEVLQFSIKFYIIGFIVLSFFYFIHLKMEFKYGYLFSFYIRRMLIHPILLLILLPSFYFHKISKN